MALPSPSYSILDILLVKGISNAYLFHVCLLLFVCAEREVETFVYKCLSLCLIWPQHLPTGVPPEAV